MLVTENRPHAVTVSLENELAEALRHNRSQVLENWLGAVRADDRLATPDTLTEPQLKDHVPKILDDFLQFLEAGGQQPEKFPASNARQHGAERWQQGYSIKEVLRELYWLRRIVLQEVYRLAQRRSDALRASASMGDVVDRYFNELEARSVSVYIEQTETALRKFADERLRLARIVSHEMRNLLNSLGLASLLLEPGDADAIQAMRKSLAYNTGHMRELLDDLSRLSHVLCPTSQARKAPFDAAKLVQQIDATYRPEAESKGLHFECAMAQSLSALSTDELMLRQILENLVSNAIKFTATGEVGVSLEEVDTRHFAIVVKDTGVGIAPADRNLIFTEGYQVKTESPLRGSGLGLTIVLGLVELLKGSIELSSTEQGGSVFRVKLPKA